MAAQTTLNLVRELCPTLSVGILTADLMSLSTELSMLERTGVKLVHVDVMDGCFCPMMTVGPPFIKALKTPLLKDVHLMITNPLEKVAEFVAAGADIVTVHPESSPHIHRVLQQMRNMSNANDSRRGLVRGVALNPGTPLQVLDPLMDELEFVLLLAVNPGWRGQEFSSATAGRIARVRQMIKESGRDILLAVDGGVTRNNIVQIAKIGADIIVAGSAVFDGKSSEQNARFMLSAIASREVRTPRGIRS